MLQRALDLANKSLKVKDIRKKCLKVVLGPKVFFGAMNLANKSTEVRDSSNKNSCHLALDLTNKAIKVRDIRQKTF